MLCLQISIVSFRVFFFRFQKYPKTNHKTMRISKGKWKCCALVLCFFVAWLVSTLCAHFHFVIGMKLAKRACRRATPPASSRGRNHLHHKSNESKIQKRSKTSASHIHPTLMNDVVVMMLWWILCKTTTIRFLSFVMFYCRGSCWFCARDVTRLEGMIITAVSFWSSAARRRQQGEKSVPPGTLCLRHNNGTRGGKVPSRLW